ncbi:MAG: exo-alpha-sialidase [Clostridia bacterium]|nr:exo-alpha-sialidase [Clostridia bacterium]
MKKIVFRLAVLAFAAMLTFCTSALLKADVDADYYYYSLPGDMDGNGIHSVKDVVMLVRELLNGGESTLADIDGDGNVSLLDVIYAIKTVTDTYEVEKVIDTRYLKTSYIENFYAESIELSADNLYSEWSAKYTDGGITVTANVETASYSSANYVGINLQSVNSIMEADRRLVRFICYGDGSYSLKRHLYSEGELVAEVVDNATTKNDEFYYSFAKTDGGYTLTVFASYEFLHSTEERSYGEIRLLPMMKCGETKVTYSELGAYYSNPETWLVLNRENKLVRDDFSVTSFADGIAADSKYKNLDFLDSLATIVATKCTLKTAAVGAPLFTDRAYSLEEHFFPTELIGKAYLYAPISGSIVEITEPGYVVLAVAENSTYDARNQKVVAAGFEPLMLAAGSSMNNASYRNNADLVNWYVKYCEVGESINLGKWTIPFANGETGTFPWETTSASLIMSPGDNYYAAEERSWNGCPTVAVTSGGRLFAGWVTGGTAEPRVENYDVMAYSDDGGETWTEIGVIDTYKNGDSNKVSKVNDVQMWLDADTNVLYIFYEMSGMQSNFEKNCAVWVFTIDNPDAPMTEWNISEHWYCFPGLLRNNITVLSDGTWLAAPNNYMDGRYTVVYASTDKGATWSIRGKAYIPQALNFDETVVTELSDGTLWMTVRTARGAIYQSFSFDKGATWTLGVASEFANPSSRFQFFTTKSGAICAIWNDSSSARVNLKAALSYDDGKTWTKPLTIYAPKNSYPDFSIEKDGTIHVVFDSGRYKSTNSWQDRNGTTYYGAIYHVALTEEQIKNGGYLMAAELNTVTVCSETPEIEGRAFLPLSYLTDFKEKDIVISETAKTTATATYSAEYGESGVTVTATVKDPTVYTVAGDIKSGDNVTIMMQGVNSIAVTKRFTVGFTCDGAGNYILGNHTSFDEYTEIEGIDPTKVNDKCYFTFTKTSEGYKVNLFVSYDLMHVGSEQAFGKVRMAISLRNADSSSESAYRLYGEDEGVMCNGKYTLPNTWLVLDKENNFIRDDFDTVSFAEDVVPSNPYSDLKFLDNLATISAGENGVLREAKAGAQVFIDNTYSFEESYLPKEVIGKAFVGGLYEEGCSATVTESGYVLLLAGEYASFDIRNEKIKNAGWTQILYAAGTPFNKGVRVGVAYLSNWYVKYCEAGETISFGKLAIPFANGETTPFDWDAKGADVIIGSTDPYYGFSTRLWNGCPTIEVTNGGRLISAWTTGGTREGEPENYIVFAYSDDGGARWKELCVVNSEKADDPDKTTTVCDIQIWLDKETNTLHCFYINTSKNPPYEKASAVWTFTMTDIDGEVSDIQYSEHRYLFPGLLRNNITVLSDGTWIVAPNNFLDERFCVIYASTDKGQTWTLRGKAYVPEALNYDETMVTELCDGTLWMGVRASSEKSAMYQAYSFDEGYTWTMSSPSNIFNCNTRFNFTRLESGALLMVYDAASGRKKLTAALSYDDGLSWTHSVTLYEAYSTYPDVSLYYDADGKETIHIIFDRDRYEYGQIYHVALSEEYIRDNNGKVLSPEKDLNLVTTLK